MAWVWVPDEELELAHFSVVFREKDWAPLDVDIFQCQAIDADHAEEHCQDAYEDAEILWSDNETDPQDSLKNWSSVSLESQPES